jgi:hypothetical protein
LCAFGNRQVEMAVGHFQGQRPVADASGQPGEPSPPSKQPTTLELALLI